MSHRRPHLVLDSGRPSPGAVGGGAARGGRQGGPDVTPTPAGTAGVRVTSELRCRARGGSVVYRAVHRVGDRGGRTRRPKEEMCNMTIGAALVVVVVGVLIAALANSTIGLIVAAIGVVGLVLAVISGRTSLKA